MTNPKLSAEPVQKPAPITGKTTGPPKDGPRYSRFFTHWRTGVVYDAWDYGYKAWPIGA